MLYLVRGRTREVGGDRVTLHAANRADDVLRTRPRRQSGVHPLQHSLTIEAVRGELELDVRVLAAQEVKRDRLSVAIIAVLGQRGEHVTLGAHDDDGVRPAVRVPVIGHMRRKAPLCGSEASRARRLAVHVAHVIGAKHVRGVLGVVKRGDESEALRAVRAEDEVDRKPPRRSSGGVRYRGHTDSSRQRGDSGPHFAALRRRRHAREGVARALEHAGGESGLPALCFDLLRQLAGVEGVELAAVLAADQAASTASQRAGDAYRPVGAVRLDHQDSQKCQNARTEGGGQPAGGELAEEVPEWKPGTKRVEVGEHLVARVRGPPEASAR